MGELGVLFNPGMRHEQEERLAKQMLREDEGAGRKGRHGIDLEAGVVVIGSASADGRAEPEASVAERRAVAGDVSSDSDEAGTAAGAHQVDPASVTSPTAAPPAGGVSRKPGEPRVASRVRGATPTGKARHQSATGAGQSAPVGKSRRSR